jgi:predicted enzyme related to lactoylglutathione lyase
MSTDPHVSGNAARGAEPEPFHATVLSASLTVNDLERSLAWYRDVVGFTVHQTFERAGTLFAVSLRAGAVPILLTRDDGAKGLDRAKGEGISLQLTTTQDVDAVAERIRSRGGALDSEPADMRGARVFRLRDPDGFRLVISSPR